MRKIRFLFNVFSRVTACVVIAVAAFTTILEPTDTVETAVLWQIPAVSALCALTCLIYPWDRTLGKAEMGIRTLIHYLLINGIVLGAGFWFRWYRIDRIQSIAAMLITIALIFALVSAVTWAQRAEEAKRMNERLREYQEKKAKGEIMD
ncbi:DUF3021 domain-containing protein [uncultured Acetatifactor sp.]|uniref:DUF3021 domain-containing protein n=1 Tax=uncultured Acetatifactor sp. TaxID=1671927 RepID=UPI002633817A|nr:DUF3021 domain-containing protein [uncultured Acetatifactor sp.]